MKCLVCNYDFNGIACPKCKFPVVEIPGDYETGLKTLQPTVMKYRTEFGKKIRLGVVVHNYDVTDTVTYKGEQTLPAGTADSMMSTTKWLSGEFTNIPSRSKVPVTLSVAVGDEPEYKVTLNADNLPSETLQLGISVDDQMRACFILRDGFGNTSPTETVYLLK